MMILVGMVGVEPTSAIFYNNRNSVILQSHKGCGFKG